jgi:nucleoid DNA-binding protein
MAKKLAKKKSVTPKARKKAKVTSSKKIASINKSYTKTELIGCIVKHTELPKKKVVEVLETLQAVMHAHAKSGCPFSLPGQFKLTVVKKPATKARKGVNPFTGEPTTFKAKPARKIIKIKPLKKLKAAV